MVADAQLAKQQGNAAFEKKDYHSARDLYAVAMQIDPSEYRYPLNKSITNLNLERWAEAEQDATTALRLAPGNLKAFFRRSTARRQQGNFEGARQDIEAYSKAGGDRGLTEKATAQIAAAELATTTSTLEAKLGGTPVLPTVVLPTVDDVSSTHRKFAFREVEGRGLGAFATREFHRGDLILADQPLFTNNDRKPVNVISAVQKLSPNEKKEFFSLKNAHSGSQGPICGIFNTNAFSISDTASAICMLASRFNHSCSPNARYSWHAAGGRLRIYALRKIAVGEEVFVSYISGRRVYGSRRKDRQDRLKTYGFICSCVVCSLPLSEQKASDRRRAEIARIWESVPYYMPHQTADRLRAIVHAVHLLEEEGYAADKDDFTNDAATICASHADWESVEYWATKTYETRVAEFGEDSQRAADVRNIYLDLKRSPNAATQRKQKFSVRL